MIEFELKYKISSPERLLKFVKGKDASTQRDDYYDTEEGLLYQNGNFLRLRDGKRIDFKLFAGDDTHLFCEETNFELNHFSSNNLALMKVCQHVGLTSSPFKDFERFCLVNSLCVIAPISKKRIKFKKEDIVLSVDEIEGLGTFLEAELDFPDADFDKIAAKKVLEDRLIKEGLIDLSEDKYVKVGYVELYLLEHHPELYQLGKYKI